MEIRLGGGPDLPADAPPIKLAQELIDELDEIRSRAQSGEDTAKAMGQLADKAIAMNSISQPVRAAYRSKLQEFLRHIPIAGNTLYQSRMDICKSCDEANIAPPLQTLICSKCGCVMSLKNRLAPSSCPLRKF
jgi:hypothetical protein